MLRVNECFKSLQGEGPDSGIPAIFLRLSGCNVRCSFCDTKYAFVDGTQYLVEEVAYKIRLLAQSGLVVITGGEPLIQQEELGKLIQLLLLKKKYHFVVETNGTLSKPLWWRKVIWDIDFKCPSSGVFVFNNEWLALGDRHRIKCVVSDENDLSSVLGIIKRVKDWQHCSTLLVSPAIGGDVTPFSTHTLSAAQIQQRWFQRVWEFCVENNLRYSLQIHKVVFGNKRGV